MRELPQKYTASAMHAFQTKTSLNAIPEPVLEIFQRVLEPFVLILNLPLPSLPLPVLFSLAFKSISKWITCQKMCASFLFMCKLVLSAQLLSLSRLLSLFQSLRPSPSVSFPRSLCLSAVNKPLSPSKESECGWNKSVLAVSPAWKNTSYLHLNEQPGEPDIVSPSHTHWRTHTNTYALSLSLCVSLSHTHTLTYTHPHTWEGWMPFICI